MKMEGAYLLQIAGIASSAIKYTADMAKDVILLAEIYISQGKRLPTKYSKGVSNKYFNNI